MEEKVKGMLVTKDQYFNHIWDIVSPIDITTEQGKMDFIRIISDENYESLKASMLFYNMHQEILEGLMKSVTLLLESLKSISGINPE
jgi:hypothetical protein